MKILHIIASVDPAGGGPIEGIIRLQSSYLAAGGAARVEIASLDEADAEFLAQFPLTVHALGKADRSPQQPLRNLLNHWRYSPLFVPWLRENAPGYDAIIVNGLWNYASFGASCVLPGGRTPYFVFSHGMLDPWFRTQYPLKHLAKQAFWLAGEGRLVAGARSVLFTCEEERRKARGQFWGYRYNETVVGYGASAAPCPRPELEVAFRSAVPALGDRPYFLFLGRIHPKKGCDLLVEAYGRIADRCPEIDLVMAGPDQLGWTEELKGLAQRLGVSNRVHWTGALYGDAKWGALHGAQAFCLPSHQENFGIAVAEALGCGTPVLISDQVDIWREISDAGAGLVSADTLAGTQSVLEQWLTLSSASHEEMRVRARTLFQSRFDVATTGPALLETIKRMM